MKNISYVCNRFNCVFKLFLNLIRLNLSKNIINQLDAFINYYSHRSNMSFI